MKQSIFLRIYLVSNMKFLILFILSFIALALIFASAILLFTILPLGIYKDEQASIDFDKLIEQGKR